MTRFSGHLIVGFGGVHHGRQDGSIRAGVLAADGGAGRHGPDAGIAVQGIRAFAWTIGLWVKQAQRDAGGGDGGLTSAEHEELQRLRRENRRLKEERDILSKAAAWFATENGPSKRSSGS